MTEDIPQIPITELLRRAHLAAQNLKTHTMPLIEACPHCQSTAWHHLKKGKRCRSCRKRFDTPVLRPKKKDHRMRKRIDPRQRHKPTTDELYSLLSCIIDDEKRALCVFLYLSGARVSEVMRSIRRFQISVRQLEGNEFMLLQDVPTLKKRGGGDKNPRTIPLSMQREGKMIRLMTPWINQVPATEFVFRATRKWAYTVVRGCLGWHPHFLRHLRTYHLKTEYHLNDSEVMEWNNWSDTRPVTRYGRIGWADLARRMG